MHEIIQRTESTPNGIVFIRGEKVTVVIEHREAHAIGMRWEDLVKAPNHITAHVVFDAMGAIQHQCLIVQDRLIASLYGAGINSFSLRSFKSHHESLGGHVALAGSCERPISAADNAS